MSIKVLAKPPSLKNWQLRGRTKSLKYFTLASSHSTSCGTWALHNTQVPIVIFLTVSLGN